MSAIHSALAQGAPLIDHPFGAQTCAEHTALQEAPDAALGCCSRLFASGSACGACVVASSGGGDAAAPAPAAPGRWRCARGLCCAAGCCPARSAVVPTPQPAQMLTAMRPRLGGGEIAAPRLSSTEGRRSCAFSCDARCVMVHSLAESGLSYSLAAGTPLRAGICASRCPRRRC